MQVVVVTSFVLLAARRAVGATAIDDQHIRFSSSRRAVSIHRSAFAFACGARAGVGRMPIPSLANTTSKHGELAVAVPNHNRNCAARSARSIRKLRACRTTQTPVGWAVTPKTWT